MVCDNCALRLFNNKHHNLQGIGNPYLGRCIVIPNVDYGAYKKGDISFSNQVEIIKSIISFTGELDVYIVPLIRCCESISCELDADSYNRCIQFFAKDIRAYDFKDILLLGNAGRRFLNCNISDYLDTICVSNNNRRYAINYSPYIKDDSKFEIFKNHLTKWYNAVINNDFQTYKILRI